jgi:hypothetical protein
MENSIQVHNPNSNNNSISSMHHNNMNSNHGDLNSYYLGQKHQNLLTCNDSDITDFLIIETDRSPKVIEQLVKYMYTCGLDQFDDQQQQQAKDIYEISKEYKVHGLTNLAREHLIKEVSVQNCCDYLVFSVVNNDYELNSKIQTFITDNYEAITKTNAYKQAKRKYRELFENTFNELLAKKANSGLATTSS